MGQGEANGRFDLLHVAAIDQKLARIAEAMQQLE